MLSLYGPKLILYNLVMDESANCKLGLIQFSLLLTNHLTNFKFASLNEIFSPSQTKKNICILHLTFSLFGCLNVLFIQEPVDGLYMISRLNSANLMSSNHKPLLLLCGTIYVRILPVKIDTLQR